MLSARINAEYCVVPSPEENRPDTEISSLPCVHALRTVISDTAA